MKKVSYQNKNKNEGYPIKNWKSYFDFSNKVNGIWESQKQYGTESIFWFTGPLDLCLLLFLHSCNCWLYFHHCFIEAVVHVLVGVELVVISSSFFYQDIIYVDY